MIGKRTLAGVAALALAVGALGATAPAASAAPMAGPLFGVPGIYGFPPPQDRGCWHWSHWQHQWVWACNKPHPMVQFDRRAHRWDYPG